LQRWGWCCHRRIVAGRALRANRRTAIAWQSDTSAVGRSRIVGGLDWSDNDLIRGTRAPGTLPATFVNVSLFDPVAVTTPAAFLNFVPQAEACLKTRSPFVEALVEPIEGLRLIASLRRDDIDLQRIDRLNAANSLTRDYQPTTGRIGVVWSPAPQWNLYGSFTTAAEPVQQFVSITSAQGALSLQRGRQVEVGLKATTLGGDLDFTAAAYQIVKSDPLTTTVINGQSVSQTVGEQKSRGIELAAAWRINTRLAIEANVAYTDAEFARFNEAVAGATLVRDGNTPPNVPTWIANAFVRYEFAPRWTLSAGGRHVGRCYANNANLIDLGGFEVFDAGIDFSPGRWTVGVRGRNLTDELYAD
jgi:iron complex outermembrane receptor protein